MFEASAPLDNDDNYAHDDFGADDGVHTGCFFNWYKVQTS